MEILRNNSQYSYKSILRFKSIKDIDQGTYECRAFHVYGRDNEVETKFISLFVHGIIFLCNISQEIHFFLL